MQNACSNKIYYCQFIDVIKFIFSTNNGDTYKF